MPDIVLNNSNLWEQATVICFMAWCAVTYYSASAESDLNIDLAQGESKEDNDT